MSSAIERIAILHYSPYVVAPLIEEFYKYTKEKPNNILLSYLVLPLVLHPDTRRFLKNSRTTSSLHTFCKERTRMYGLPERVQELKMTTNQCLFLAKESGAIEFRDDMSICFKEKTLDNSASSKDMLIAARKLGSLLSLYDVPTCYRVLGVKQL